MTDMLLIRNARLVNEGAEYEAEVLVRGERIERIDASITTPPRARVLDAGGAWLMPGMIDDQVHFREPGLTRKGEIATESSAAVAGGITSYMEMPNVSPQTVTREALRAKHARAAEVSRANYAFYLGATAGNIGEIERLRADEACGVKIFMGASTGDMLVDDPQVLAAIFARSPVLIVTHCEDTPLIRENEQAWRARFGEQVPAREHAAIRSAEAGWRSSSLAVSLAREHDARLKWRCSSPGTRPASASPPRPACTTCGSATRTTRRSGIASSATRRSSRRPTATHCAPPSPRTEST